MSSPKPHHCRIAFRELKARLFEKGCGEELQDVIKGAPPGVSPQERYITNPATGKSICSEHWGDDEEEAEAEFCEHVCRSLGLEQHEITFFATDGEEVTVNTPVPRPSN